MKKPFAIIKVMGILCLSSSFAWAHDIPEGLPSELADQYETLTNQLAVETLKGQLEAKRKANALLQKQTAEAVRDVAVARKNAEIAISQAELAKRRFPDIEVNVASVFQISDPSRKCDATYFVEWQCHKGDPFASPPIPGDKCNFAVDENICGLPGATGFPLMFEVQYSCGTQMRKQRVPFGTNAYLTCR